MISVYEDLNLEIFFQIFMEIFSSFRFFLSDFEIFFIVDFGIFFGCWDFFGLLRDFFKILGFFSDLWNFRDFVKKISE